MNFREFVKACAKDSETVADFNLAHGMTLKCPIKALIEPVLPANMTESEKYQVAWFMAWVKHARLPREQAAAANIEKLRSFYRTKRRADSK
jgi:hypothetical protein